MWLLWLRITVAGFLQLARTAPGDCNDNGTITNQDILRLLTTKGKAKQAAPLRRHGTNL